MKKGEETKQKILDAALYLFTTKGFHGTSVREISTRANVNVANISYYFDGKAGLLEHFVATFLEGYVQKIEQIYYQLDKKSATELLLTCIRDVMYYQQENGELTRFVQREISLDTILIREVMSTYLTKEKIFLQTILERGIKQQEFRKVSSSYTIMQLKGMLSMPYLNLQYLVEVLHVMPFENYFIEKYIKELETWVISTICTSPMSSYKKNRPLLASSN